MVLWRVPLLGWWGRTSQEDPVFGAVWPELPRRVGFPWAVWPEPPRRVRFPGPWCRNFPGGSGSLGSGATTSQEGPTPWALGRGAGASQEAPWGRKLPGRRVRPGSLGRVVALGWLRIYEGAAFSWDFSEFRVRGVAKSRGPYGQGSGMQLRGSGGDLILGPTFKERCQFCM